MASSNDDGFGCGCVFGILLLLAVGYVALNTDNPIRDKARKKAFDMSVEHVKEKILGKKAK